MYYIGIDLGTSAVKLLLVDQKGKILNSVSKEYPLAFIVMLHGLLMTNYFNFILFENAFFALIFGKHCV